MKVLAIFSIVAVVSTCVYSNAIPAINADENLCPPPESIAPCTCYKTPNTQRVTAHCFNFTNADDLKAIFDRNPDWNLQDVLIEGCVMSYLPAKILEDAHFETLNVSSTTLVTLFDTTPITTQEFNLYMIDVKIMRGFDWGSIANFSLLAFGIWNMEIKYFGQDFKDNIPKGVQTLWFENTGVSSIRDQAYAELKNLTLLVLNTGNLKNLSGDMFPSQSNIKTLDFSYNKIAALPEKFFDAFPNLLIFFVEGNLLTTISEQVFTKHKVLYAFHGNPIDCNCNIKWVTEKITSAFLHGECAEPESLKGTELKSLKEANFRYCH